jgi:hypothetical protein
MKILFPCHPLKRRAVDPDFEAEAEAADEAGFGLVLYNLDVLRNNDVDGALTGWKCLRHRTRSLFIVAG